MKYKVNDDGIQALHSMAEALLSAADAVADCTVKTINTASDHDQVLGPHMHSLMDALSVIKRRMEQSVVDVNEISEILDEVADDYQTIVDHDRLAAGERRTRGPSAAERKSNVDRTPVNGGIWSGDRGQAVWTPNNALAREALERYGATGVSYRNGIADFSPFAAAEFKLKPSEYHMTDAEQFGIMNDALSDYFDDVAASLGADPADPLRNPAFRDWMKKTFRCDDSEMEIILADVQAGNTPFGFTWHHTEKPGVMQLVPSIIHSSARHRGGRSIWGGGAQCRFFM